MPQSATSPLVRSYLKRKRTWSDHSKEVAVGILNRWCDWLDGRNVNLLEARGDDCTDFLDWRQTMVLSATVHKDWQHLCWFYEWAVREGELDTNKTRGPMHNIDAPRVGRAAPEKVRPCDADMFATLMASFNSRLLVDCRNAAIVSLMYRSGLRVSEVVRADIERLDLAAEIPTVEVLGKNGKWRRVPLAHETAVWVERYLRRLGHDRPTEGALFLATYNGSISSGGRLKVNAIRDMLKRRCRRLGIDVTAHMFRRGFAIESRRKGLNDTTIMAIADWQDARMLDRYIRAERQQLAAVEFAAADTTATDTSVIRRKRTKRLHVA